jgi:outer membrane protein OmpA-like peptidoglycan-associated protein
MSGTLVDGLTDVFRSQALGPFVARSGESESSVLRGFQASIETMIASLAAKLRQTGFAREALDLINSPANDYHVLEHADSLVGQQQKTDGLGSKFTSMLFGNKLSAITESISSTSGLHGGSAASLMSLGAPLLLGSLVQRIRQSGMDATKLSSYLSEEASLAQGALPPRVMSLLGTEVETAVPPVATAVIAEKSSRSWLWPLLLAALLVAGLIWWFVAGRPGTQAVENAASATANMITRSLPGNIDLHIPKGRMEDNLLTFIQDTSKPADETTWFDFDRLLFDTNAATLQPASQEQLNNIAAILKAYPNVKVKIGGYTDNTGDAQANLTLSQQRADNVRQQLIGMGIAPDRMDAQGYGEEHPVGDNNTAEGRQQNRRISLHVTQK